MPEAPHCARSWPAQRRLTEARWATLHRVAIRSLEDEPTEGEVAEGSRPCTVGAT
ncbi:hypothetical protein BC826DRAFT_1037103, partial [Russula brevipes]